MIRIDRERAGFSALFVTLSLSLGSAVAAPVPAAPADATEASDTADTPVAAAPADDGATVETAPADPARASANSPTNLGTISVTGVAIPGNPLTQAANVDVVDSDAMQADGVSNLGEGLDQLAGVNSIGTGNVSGKPVIRGLSGLRVKILSDDIGIANQAYGVRHMPVTDPFLIDRAEVVRGASSVLYGSSALGGAINLIPMEIAYGHTATGELLGRYNTNNQQWDTGVKATGGTERFGYAAGLIRRSGEDIHTPDEPTYFPGPDAAANSDAPAYSGRLPFTDFNQINGTFALGMNDDTLGEWQLRYGRWDDEHNFLLPPPAGIKPPPAGAEGVGQYIDDQQIQLTGQFDAAGIHWKPNFLWQNNRRRSNAGGYPRNLGFDGTIDLEFNQYTARLTGQNGPFMNVISGGTFGVEYMNRQQESRGRVQLSPGGEINNVGVFAFEEKDIGDFTLQAGVRYDFHTVGAKASDTANPSQAVRDADTRDFSVVTGSLGGVYAFTDHLSLAANVGRGFRAPSLFELYVAGQHGGVAAFQRGNENLDPETSLDSSVSLRWVSDRVTAKLSGYRNGIDDYIYLVDTGQTQGGLPVFDHAQTDAVLYGAEASVEAQLLPWMLLHAQGELISGERQNSNEDLPLIPANNFGVGARFTPGGNSWPPGAYGAIDVTYYASQGAAPGEPFTQFDNAPFGTASTDSYALVGLGAGVAPEIAGHEVQFDLRVNNLLDEPYRNFLDTYKGYALSPGRDIRLTTRVPFDL